MADVHDLASGPGSRARTPGRIWSYGSWRALRTARSAPPRGEGGEDADERIGRSSLCTPAGAADAAAVGLLRGVLLDQHPLIAAVSQGCGRTRRRHRGGWAAPSRRGRIRGRARAPQGRRWQGNGAARRARAAASPGGRGGRHRVAPGAAEPLHGLAGPEITGEIPERIEDVIQAHLPHPVQQGARVVEHHPGLAALAEQLPDELAHALVASHAYRRIVVVADVLMVHHPRQVADDRRGRAGRRRPGLAGACAARPRMCWRRALYLRHAGTPGIPGLP